MELDLEGEMPVLVGDDTPTITEQARLNGWKAEIFDFGRANEPGIEMFNPGLVRRPDGLWLMVRRSEIVQGMWYGKNAIWACKLEPDMKPKGGPLLTFPDSAPEEQFEDARAIYWNNQVWIGCVNFTWFPDGSWTGAHQMLGIFRCDPEWTAIARRDPPVETNKGAAGFTDGKNEKNWIWFFLDGKLHLLYTSDPWKVIEFGANWDEQKNHVTDGVRWKYGQVRGGTPPIQVGDQFITFFHSSLPWRGRYRRYYMGAIAFESKPPFRPTLWTQEPLLVGSQNDPWQQRKPLVVFPCGAIFEDDFWTISLGVNDLKSAWLKLPHEDLQKLLKPIPVAPATSLLAQATEKPQEQHIPFTTNGLELQATAFDPALYEDNSDILTSTEATAQAFDLLDKPPVQTRLEKLRANMAKARAKAAENRRLGIKSKKKRRKRRSKTLTRNQKGRKSPIGAQST